MPRKRRAALLCLAAAALLAALFWRRKAPLERYSVSWFDLFDTVTVVQGYASSQAEWDAQMEALHGDLLYYHRLFDIYEEYDGLVNLCTVNARAGREPVTVDGDLADFLRWCAAVPAGKTQGACNVAAGSVLRLWHDARAQDSPAPPDDAAITEALCHIDPENLVLDGGTVRFTDPDLCLDVGAVGKGYAVGRAVKAAEQRGLKSALLNVGGMVCAIGEKPGGERWTAGVENPWDPSAQIVTAVELAPGDCLVTSGDYQRYFTWQGVRYHHLIDLATGQPARYYSAVAVLCRDPGLGDAYSTGLFCLPPDESAKIAEEQSLAVLWMMPDQSTRSSAAWEY